ncbi:hypothetical protein HDV03_001398 [Kappamyces sp. JEL0829]|nr:hypothetical protein HDV03_001398 [Kappamyces sp. JEL0829]
MRVFGTASNSSPPVYSTPQRVQFLATVAALPLYPPASETVPSRATTGSATSSSVLSDSHLIPSLPASKSGARFQRIASSKSAGFTSASQRSSSADVQFGGFDSLLKTKALDIKAQRVLAQNTAMNVSVKPTKSEIHSINSRWESMMSLDHSPLSSAKKKEKRSISFNEKVTCHKITRIKDILDEYDAFEQEFYDECEARFAAFDDDALSTGSSVAEVPKLDQSTSDAQDQDFLNMSLEDILDTKIQVSNSPAARDKPAQHQPEATSSDESRDAAPKSLAPAPLCAPGTEPGLAHRVALQPNPPTTTTPNTTDHIDELESLLNRTQSIAFATPRASLTTSSLGKTASSQKQSSETTLSSQSAAESFWQMVKRQFSFDQARDTAKKPSLFRRIFSRRDARIAPIV